MKALEAAVETTLLIAPPMMLATYVYLRGAVQDYLLGNHGPWVESCMENSLTAPFLSSYVLTIVIGILPAIVLGAGAGWVVELSGKSQRRQMNTAILTAAVLTLLAVGFLSLSWTVGVRYGCIGTY